MACKREMKQDNFQRSLDIVVCVLREKDIAALNKVKDFLYSLPSPRQTEQALASAVLYCAQYDQQVFDWIILHQASLSPELDLFAFTRNLVSSRLFAEGWIQNRDFLFDLQSLLITNRLLDLKFRDYFNQGELVLISAILKI